MSLMGHNEHVHGLPWKLQNANRYTSIDGKQYYVKGSTGNHHWKDPTNGIQSSFKICYGVDGTGDIYNWENVV